MKKALDKAISKGGKVPEPSPKTTVKKDPKSKSSPKQTSDKGFQNMKKQLQKAKSQDKGKSNEDEK